MAITVTPLSDSIGAEATGVDLSAPLDAETAKDLYRAWVDNIVLVIPDQDLTPEKFVKATQNFGKAMQQNLKSFAVPGHPEINVVSSEDKDVTAGGKPFIRGVTWHTDHSFTPVPPKGTVLYGIDIPSRGGDTSFCSMRNAYETLPETTKERIDGLKTLHVYESSRRVMPMIGRTKKEAEEYPGNVEHPLVRTNPDTDRKAIYLNPNRLECVIGLDRAESDALLDELMEHATQPQFQYHHKWRKGDFVIWDNRSALHHANADYDPGERRYLHRIMIAGETPQ